MNGGDTMTPNRMAGLLLFSVGSLLQAQRSMVELGGGWVSPSSDLADYARPGAFLELRIGDPAAPANWGWRMRLETARESSSPFRGSR